MRLATLLICLGGLLGIAAAFQLPKPVQTLPAPFATQSVGNSPKVIPQPAGATLKLPAGFEAGVWATGFSRPRFMLLGRKGEILLADSARPGSVIVFPEAKPSLRKTLISGLDRPYGLALWQNYLYVAQPESVTRYPYDENKFTVGPGQQVISLAGFTTAHITRCLLFDRAGKKLYVSIGSGSNVDTGEDPRRAAIVRYNPDGSGQEIFASGTRNPVSIHWYPNSDTLWASVQERDGLGDDLVPDYFTSIKQGAFYGWPYAYTGPHEEPRHKGERPDLVARTVKGDVLLGSHVAVLDFRFYTGQSFPQRYRGGAFLALHGSWNRSRRTGYCIAFVPFQNGRPSGPPENFLTGWMLSPTSKQVWGRPVGLLVLPDGSLLISDDGANRIWRVSYK
ncbi:MAG: PQQ-dependent sugar dehydrogenase [Bryobacterales bacterium]|nr:PQQ-dependent sugar dehydrogenase [Bryobacterales bacterium]